MRIVQRLALAVLAVTLTAGPLLAAPVSLTGGPILTAPAPHASALGRAWQLLGGGLVVFGAIRVRDIGQLSKKFVTRAGAAQGDYKSGVEAAGSDWQARTRASGDAYQQGVQQAITDKRFERGVDEAGAQKFVARASTLGAQRFGPGVAAAEGDWARGFQPYHAALQGMDLPVRGPRGSQQNYAISNAVAQRLAAIKRGK